MARKTEKSGILTRLARPLRRLMGGAIDEAPAPVPVRKAAVDERLTEDSFRLAIDSLAKDQDGRFQTKLQIISLIEFREAVGDKWWRVADKVMMIAEGVVKQYLGEGNSCTRQGQDFFVLVFRGCSQPEGRRRALMIAQELGTRLLGDQFIGMTVPLALAAEVTLGDALNPDGGLNLDILAAAIGEMRSLVADSALPAPPPAKTPQPAPSEAARPLPTAPFEPVARAAEEPGWRELEVARPKRGWEDPAWRTMERPSTSAVRPDSVTPPLPADARLSLLWRPTWVADGEAIGAYKAQLQRVDAVGAAPLEGSRAYPVGGGTSAPILDRAVAAGAVRELRGADSGAGATLIVPLHWASLASAQRSLVAAPFADITETVRNRRVLLDVFGVPAEVTERDLVDTLRAARQLCRQVALRVRLGAPMAGLAADCGAAMIGIDLAELTPSERTDDEHLIAALEAFQREADIARLGAYVWGVRRRKAVAGAVVAGFAMVNGAALMKDLNRPAKVLPAPKSRFAAGA